MRGKKTVEATHDLALQVGIAVILSRPIVVVLASGLVRRQFFKPNVVIVRKPVLSVIYEYRRSHMHRIYPTQPLVTPLFRTRPSTVDVMFTKPRRFGTWNQRYSVSDFTEWSCHKCMLPATR